MPPTIRKFVQAASLMVIVVTSGSALGQGLVYVDADDDFTGGGANSNIAPLSAFNLNTAAADNLWGWRENFGAAGPGGRWIYESGGTGSGVEDSGEVSQTISGLSPGTSYELYAVYWSATAQNWTIRTGTSSGNLTLYDRTGATAGATAGVAGGAAIWATPPTIAGLPAYTEGDRAMYLGLAGTVTAGPSGQATVYFDDLPNTGFADRSWIDGVAYVPAAFDITLAATLNRDTGVLTLTNNTGVALSVASYAINSAAGALNPTEWTPIAGRLDGGGDGSFDTDAWSITTQTPTQLAEQEATIATGGTLSSTPISFGDLWRRTPTQDVQLNLTLTDTRVLNVPITYTGTQIIAGDFDGMGGITATDFGILMNNLNTTLTTTTIAEAYMFGDITADGAVTFADFRAFKAAYETANGPGSFATMVGAVPEPSSWLLAACVAAIAGYWRRGRSLARARCGAIALVATVMASSAAHAQLVYVDATDDVGGNTTLADGSTLVATDTTGATTWRQRDGAALGANGTVFEGVDPSPLIKTTITGLTPNAPYQVYAHFWDPPSTVEDWNISAGFSPTTLKVYSREAAGAATGSIASVLASTLTYTTPPNLFTNATPSTRDNLAANLNVVAASAAGELVVYVDDLPSTNVNLRTWYDGLSYAPAIIPTLEVNTTTGTVKLTNTTSTTFDIDYYEIRSAGAPTGSLNVAGWNSLDEQEGTDPIGTGWDSATGASSQVLSEGNLLGSMMLEQNDVVSLGSAFTVGGAQDLTFFYSSPGGGLLQGFVAYVEGGGALAGDYNNDGTVNAADYTVWRDNVGSPDTVLPPGSTTDGSGFVDAGDYATWRANFGASSAGAAAFASTSVPEPTAAVTLTIVAALFVARVVTRM